MADYKSFAEREKLSKLGFSPIPSEPSERIGKFQDYFRRGFEQAEAQESDLLNLAYGTAQGAVTGLGSLAAMLSSSAVTPMNLPFKVADYALSKNPSDLILPQPLGQGPVSKELQGMRAEFDQAFQNSDAAQFGAFVAEWVPALYSGAVAANTMRGLTMAAVPSLLKSVGERELVNRFSSKTAKAMAALGDDMASSIAKRATGEVVGGIPFFERMMMAVGNATGFASFEATRTLGKTGNAEVALKEGAYMAAAGFGIEVGLVGLGRLAFPSFRTGPVDTTKAWKRFDDLAPKLQDEILAGDTAALRMKEGKLVLLPRGADAKNYLTEGEAGIAKLVELEVASESVGFAEALMLTSPEGISGLAPREAKAMLQAFSRRYPGADIDGVVKDLRSSAGVTSPRSGGTNLLAGKELTKEIKSKVDAIHKAEQQLRSSVAVFDSLDEAMISPNLRRMLDDTPISPAQRLEELGSMQNAFSRMALDQVRRRGFASPLVRMQELDLAVRKQMFSLYVDVLEGFRLRWLESPGGMSKRLGVSGLKVMELTEAAENEIKALRSHMWVATDQLDDTIIKYGQGNKHLPHHADGKLVTTGDRHWIPIRTAYEDGNIAAVEREFGPEIARAWEEAGTNPLKFHGERLQGIGVNSMMTETEMGAKGYWPQEIKKATDYSKIEKQMKAAAMRNGMNSSEADAFVNSSGWKRTGLRQWGSIDQQRKIPGTTQQKIELGVPLEESPKVALRDHLDASIVRYAVGKRFGPNGELGSFYKAAIIDEGGSEAAAHQLLDTILFESASNQAAAKWSKVITSSQIVTKLAWAVIPNVFQTTITAIRFGPMAAMKGIKEGTADALSNFRMMKHFQDTLKTTDKEAIAHGLGLMEGSILAGKTIFEGNHPTTFSEAVAEQFLKKTGFTMSERMNRMIAAHAGLGHSRDIIQRVASGELRGANWITARRSLDSLGVDAEKVLARYKATGRLGFNGEEIDQIISQSVKQTQFSTGVLDIPPAWRTPKGKVLMQFKTFAFSAGKTMRDQVWREFDQGNYKPFLYFMTLGSVSGEAIGAATSMIKGKPRNVPNGPARIIEDISNFGGFGLAKSLVDSALYGKTLDFILGPAVSTVASLGQNIMQRGVSEGINKSLQREPTVQAIQRGVGVGAALLGGTAEMLYNGWWDFGVEEEEEEFVGSGIDQLRKEMGRYK